MKKNWKEELSRFFEELRIIESSKESAFEDFKKFCEFIIEPAFENFSDELKQYGLRSRYKKEKERFLTFLIDFPKSTIDNFHYTIYLPDNSIDLRLRLIIKGRKDKKTQLIEKIKPFLDSVHPKDCLKLRKEDIIRDIMRNYRNFCFEDFIKSK